MASTDDDIEGHFMHRRDMIATLTGAAATSSLARTATQMHLTMPRDVRQTLAA